MASHAKARVKRPQPHPSFVKEIGRMKKEFDEAKDGAALDERKTWLLEFLFLVSEWRKEKRVPEKSRLEHEIAHSQKKGDKAGFTAKERSALAWVVTEAASENRLDTIYADLDERVSNDFKKHIKEIKIGKKRQRELLLESTKESKR